MRCRRILILCVLLGSWSACGEDKSTEDRLPQATFGGGASGHVDADVQAGASGSGQAGASEPRARFVPGTSAPQETPPLDCGIDRIALENAGPPQNRVNFVILGDGYDASAVDKAYLDQLAWAMQARFSAPTGEPYLRYRKFVNICAFKVVSATNGIGNGPTAFDCTGNDSTRVILCNTGAPSSSLRPMRSRRAQSLRNAAISQAEPAHSHPITAEHSRMRRERALVAELDQSMHLRDLATFDAALATYRSEFPEDPRNLQEGYTIMSACLRGPNSSSRRAAEEFYRAHRSSTLRRWLRRICIAERDL